MPPEEQVIQQVESAPVQQTGDLRSMLDQAAENPHQDDTFKAEPLSKPDQSTDNKTEQTDKPKVTAKPEKKPVGKQKALQALEPIQTEGEGEEQTQEAKTVEQAANEQEQEPQSPQAKRWSELRKIEEQYKEIAPAYEKLQKEFDDFKAKGGMTEEQKTRFDQLEQMYAVELLDTKPEFQSEVLAPMQEQLNSLKSIADHAGLDANQRQALRNAAETPDSFSRIRAIKQVLNGSTTIEDPEDMNTLVQFALEASGKYQEAKKKENGYVSKAAELAQSVRGKEAQQSVQQKQAEQAKYDAAHKEMIGTLSAPIKPLLDDAEFGPQIKEALESIRPGEEPMDKAYQAQAGEILPFTIKFINKLQQQVNTLKKSLAAREGAKPRTTDGTTPIVEQGAQQADLKSLLAGAMR